MHMRHEALRERRVPIHRRVVEILDEAPMLGCGSDLVLPAATTAVKRHPVLRTKATPEPYRVFQRLNYVTPATMTGAS